MKTHSSSRSAFFTQGALNCLVVAFFGLCLTANAANPVPLINQPLIPDAVAPGGPGFTLTVNGTGFVSGSAVKWNGSPRATVFLSGSQLTATILDSDIVTTSTASVTVVNPVPGGGISNSIFLPIRVSTLSVALSRSDITNSRPGLAIGIAQADFNHDGALDLAVTYGCCAFGVDNTVSVLLGNGDGKFQRQVDYETAGEPNSVAVGDFDGDGNVDLVTSDYTPAKVSVLLGNGDGTFRAHTDYATRDYSVDVVTGDFNRDGKLDLATSNPGPESCCGTTVSILLGNGDGTFQHHVDVVVGAAPTGVTAADFNDDSNLDLAVSKQYSDELSILLGKGDGTFQSPVDYPTGGFPAKPVAADFNGDGNLDLAVNSSSENVVSVLQGNGDGTFKPRVNYPASEGPGRIQTADFNADGVLDLVVANAVADTVSLFLGIGDGTFKAPSDYPGISGGGPSDSTLGDFNGDGSLDLAFTFVFGDIVSIFLQHTENGDSDCLAPPAGLVSWWSGDKTAGDVQGTNPGVLKNGASFARGMVGPAFLFDGIDDLVTIPNSTSLSQTRITLDAWVYITGKPGTARHIISKDNDAQTREYILGLGFDNRFVADVWLPTGIVGLGSNTVSQLNTWYHVAMTHDGAELRVYVNGILDGMAEAVGDIAPTVNPVGIGGNIAPVFFKGIIDEAQIFNRALSDAEILAIYQAGADGQCKPDIFVASIDPTYIASGHGFRISTAIVIQDTNGVGTDSANAQLGVILPGGTALTFPLKTDATGQAVVSFTASDSGLYRFKVRNVSHPTREYDRALNVETKDTLVIP
jgi:hypothetical protein